MLGVRGLESESRFARSAVSEARKRINSSDQVLGYLGNHLGKGFIRDRDVPDFRDEEIQRKYARRQDRVRKRFDANRKEYENMKKEEKRERKRGRFGGAPRLANASLSLEER